jgi:hypothetical protein
MHVAAERAACDTAWHSVASSVRPLVARTGQRVGDPLTLTGSAIGGAPEPTLTVAAAAAAELAGADRRGVPDAPPVARPKALTASPRSFEELGDQVARILREAWRAAEEIRVAARRDATALLEEARVRASTPDGAEHSV